MPYDEKFYRDYAEYLLEHTVRTSHDLVFRLFRRFVYPAPLLVVDLGCGLGEYQTYGHHDDYVGVDLNYTGQVGNFVCADYHDLSFLNQLPFMPTVFVSLFSIECFHSARDKYALYERIFGAFPFIQHGLVGGFLYEGRRNLETVEENGKIVSYQTIEDSALYISETFSELRLHMRTPSRMFGDDVVEVWKIFCRR